MDHNNNQPHVIIIDFRFRMASYIGIFLLMVNINPIIDTFTHPDIPYFDEEHLLVGFVTGSVCITVFLILEFYIDRLQKTLQKLKVLESFLSICANCKKIQNPGSDPFKQESWKQPEAYITEKTRTQFSHSICPDCITKLYPELNLDQNHE